MGVEGRHDAVVMPGFKVVVISWQVSSFLTANDLWLKWLMYIVV